MLDETMSQDTAFEVENGKADTFTFDTPEEKSSAPQATTDEDKATTPPQSGDSQEDDDSVDNKVPYSRFKKKVDEVNEYASRISMLEEQLNEIKSSRQESASQEDDEVPKEWVELYGDSDVSKRAFKIQQSREDKIREEAIEQTIERLSQRQEQESQALVENESIIDDNLADLQDKIGKKLSPKQEEELLGIVDEFSPVGPDGKYASLMSFDKAYEIYTLRNASKGQATRQARQSIANLSSDSSEGEADSSSTDYKRGWDSWREAL